MQVTILSAVISVGCLHCKPSPKSCIKIDNKVPPVPKGENAKRGVQISAGECIGGGAFTNTLPLDFGGTLVRSSGRAVKS